MIADMISPKTSPWEETRCACSRSPPRLRPCLAPPRRRTTRRGRSTSSSPRPRAGRPMRSRASIGRPDLPPDSLKDLVAYLKGAGAKTTLANAGIGSASHLCGMLLMSQLQVTLTTVPYRGTGPVMNDLLGKQVDMTCDQATNTTGPIL